MGTCIEYLRLVWQKSEKDAEKLKKKHKKALGKLRKEKDEKNV